MHAAFTGSARKPRQVNLSGRNSNPWAKTSGASSASQPAGHNALAQAQADRVKRAQDRDRLAAGRTLQRVWRGYAARSLQKQKWRREWDENEQRRLNRLSPISYNTSADHESTAYDNEAQLLYQMRLILMFLDVHEDMDRWRLSYFAEPLSLSLQNVGSSDSLSRWTWYFARLSRITARSFVKSRENRQRLTLLRLGVNLLQTPIEPNFDLQFRSLSDVLLEDRDVSVRDAVSDCCRILLSRDQPEAFEAFVQHMLTASPANFLPQLPKVISRYQTTICEAITKVLQEMDSDAALWLLANTVYLWRMLREFEQVDIAWISAVSSTLNKSANRVAESIDPMLSNSTINLPASSPVFIHSEVRTLALQETVQYVMAQFRRSARSVADLAKPLANYAVALLRAFPSKATNLRMWLYQNSPSASQGDNAQSTIQYLWRATRATNIFDTVQRDQERVISVLTEAKPKSNQFGYQPPTQNEISAWQEEWRIILFFLELYSFILKLMDDEEFFSLDDKFTVKSTTSLQFRQGALPLQDIASLGNFLKNLAFSLVWYAEQLAEYNEVEDTTTISSLFGQASALPSVPSQRPTAKTLAGNDVSQAYMKGLATGLIRMLHERDSRRKFLPDGYWLMTKHFDMQQFIPTVVEEEQRRYSALGEIEDEEDFDIEREEETIERTQTLSVGSLFNIRAPHTSRTQTSRQAEVLARQRELARKRRQLQSLNPRLEILRNLPFFIPFNTRVQIFRTFIDHDQQRRRNGFVDADDWRMSVASSQARSAHRGMDLIGRHHADIHRGSVFDDAFEQFYELGEELKEPIQISFIDQFGQPEAGIDGGGVTKEFLMSVTSEALDPRSQVPLFEENEQRYLYPKPTVLQQIRTMLIADGNRPGSEGFNVAIRGMLQRYEFLGRIVGKCMYEGILIDVNFAGFFLLKWALTGGTTSASTESAYRASINDLRDFDDQLYQGLLKLKNYAGDVETDFALNFAVSDTFDIEGKMVSLTTDLIPNGSNESVTNQNRLKYIDRIVRYRLQEQPRLISNSFLKGLGQIISPMWLAMFDQNELQKLVGGDNQELDILDLRRNTQYSGVYAIGDDGIEHPTVAMFWKVLKEMNDTDRRKVLKFVTSTPRAPLLGFSHLNPKFSIRDSSDDQTRLPSTSTCVNLLKLPRYASERTMREKLLYAANSGAGFDLS